MLLYADEIGNAILVHSHKESGLGIDIIHFKDWTFDSKLLIDLISW